MKYVVNFGRLRRRGIEAVKCEIPGKVIAYNYLHKIRKLTRTFRKTERIIKKTRIIKMKFCQKKIQIF